MVTPNQVSFRVVFELTEAGNTKAKMVLQNMKTLLDAYGVENTEIELVAHSDGIQVLVQANNAEAEMINRLSREGLVTFSACSDSMATRGLRKADLLGVADEVPSGIQRIVHRQAQGWYYVHP